MTNSFFKVVLVSIVSLFTAVSLKAESNVNAQDLLRAKTVELIVKSGSYDFTNAIFYVEGLNDKEVSELFKTLSQKNIELAGSVALIGKA